MYELCSNSNTSWAFLISSLSSIIRSSIRLLGFRMKFEILLEEVHSKACWGSDRIRSYSIAQLLFDNHSSECFVKLSAHSVFMHRLTADQFSLPKLETVDSKHSFSRVDHFSGIGLLCLLHGAVLILLFTNSSINNNTYYLIRNLTTISNSSMVIILYRCLQISCYRPCSISSKTKTHIHVLWPNIHIWQYFLRRKDLIEFWILILLCTFVWNFLLINVLSLLTLHCNI